MGKTVIRVSEADASRDFKSLLEKVRGGAEVVIEERATPIPVLSGPSASGGRFFSESVAIAEKLAGTATLDAKFGRDLTEVINRHREPLNPPEWD